MEIGLPQNAWPLYMDKVNTFGGENVQFENNMALASFGWRNKNTHWVPGRMT